MATGAQIAVNPANALKAAGPRTSEGRARVAHNVAMRGSKGLGTGERR